MNYLLAKQIHISLVSLHFLFFVSRLVLKFRGSFLLHNKLLKIAPHILDTLLLLSGLMLVHMLTGVGGQLWFQAKMILLVLYIILGMIVFRFSESKQLSIAAAMFAIVCFVGMGSLATIKPFVGG